MQLKNALIVYFLYHSPSSFSLHSIQTASFVFILLERWNTVKVF